MSLPRHPSGVIRLSSGVIRCHPLSAQLRSIDSTRARNWLIVSMVVADHTRGFTEWRANNPPLSL